MSLTEEAWRKRMWGHFPALAAILDGKQPETLFWYGASSVSDNVFDRVNRELTLFALLDSHVADVRNAIAAVPEEAERIFLELTVFRERLEDISRMFTDHADRVRRISYDAVREAESLPPRR